MKELDKDLNDFYLKKPLYNYDNINTPQYDNIIVNNDGKTLEIETQTMDYILNYIENKFSLKSFSFFKTEKHIYLNTFIIMKKIVLI